MPAQWRRQHGPGVVCASPFVRRNQACMKHCIKWFVVDRTDILCDGRNSIKNSSTCALRSLERGHMDVACENGKYSRPGNSSEICTYHVNQAKCFPFESRFCHRGESCVCVAVLLLYRLHGCWLSFRFYGPLMCSWYIVDIEILAETHSIEFASLHQPDIIVVIVVVPHRIHRPPHSHILDVEIVDKGVFAMAWHRNPMFRP